jgi:hypothetical protein
MLPDCAGQLDTEPFVLLSIAWLTRYRLGAVVRKGLEHPKASEEMSVRRHNGHQHCRKFSILQDKTIQPCVEMHEELSTC